MVVGNLGFLMRTNVEENIGFCLMWCLVVWCGLYPFQSSIFYSFFYRTMLIRYHPYIGHAVRSRTNPRNNNNNTMGNDSESSTSNEGDDSGSDISNTEIELFNPSQPSPQTSSSTASISTVVVPTAAEAETTTTSETTPTTTTTIRNLDAGFRDFKTLVELLEKLKNTQLEVAHHMTWFNSYYDAGCLEIRDVLWQHMCDTYKVYTSFRKSNRSALDELLPQCSVCFEPTPYYQIYFFECNHWTCYKCMEKCEKKCPLHC